MQNEKVFENRIKRYIKEQGGYCVKYWGGAFTQAGVPDLLICINGYFLGVEVKAEKGRPSQLQLLNIEEIKKAGGIAMVLYPKGFEEFKKLIQGLKE